MPCLSHSRSTSPHPHLIFAPLVACLPALPWHHWKLDIRERCSNQRAILFHSQCIRDPHMRILYCTHARTLSFPFCFAALLAANYTIFHFITPASTCNGDHHMSLAAMLPCVKAMSTPFERKRQDPWRRSSTANAWRRMDPLQVTWGATRDWAPVLPAAAYCQESKTHPQLVMSTKRKKKSRT